MCASLSIYACVFICMHLLHIYIYMVFITEGFFEVAIESWPEWDLNPRPLNSVQNWMLIKTEYTVIFDLNTFRQQSFSISHLYMSTIFHISYLLSTMSTMSIISYLPYFSISYLMMFFINKRMAMGRPLRSTLVNIYIYIYTIK